MTEAPFPAGPPASPGGAVPAGPGAASALRRPVDVLGIVAVCVAGIVLLPSLLVFLFGLIPSMNAIWWLGIVLIPVLGMAGVVAIVLGVVGIVVGVRRRSRYVLSIVGAVLGILMVAPIAWLFFDSLTV